MPIGLFESGEGPLDGGGSEAVLDMRIFGDVAVVVVVDKGVAQGGAVEGQDCRKSTRAKGSLRLLSERGVLDRSENECWTQQSVQSIKPSVGWG